MPKNNRWSYLNDFKKDDSGKYEFQGKTLVFAGSEEERRKAYIPLWIILALCIALGVGSGCISGAGITNTFYVIIPYIAEMSALFALGWFHFKLLTKGGEVRDYIYKSTQPRIPVASMLIAFFAIVGFILSLIFSISTGFSDGVLNAILYLVLKSVSAALALIYRNCFSKLEWIEI